jgi:hypothetical protein
VRAHSIEKKRGKREGFRTSEIATHTHAHLRSSCSVNTAPRYEWSSPSVVFLFAVLSFVPFCIDKRKRGSERLRKITKLSTQPYCRLSCVFARVPHIHPKS